MLEYGAGLTDLVKAASASSDERLHAVDYDVPAFLAKIRDYQPAWVAFHGKTAARVVARYLDVGREVAYGPQGWRVEQARVFVLPSQWFQPAPGL